MAEQDQEMPDVAVDATQPIYQEPTELEIDPHERFLRIVYQPTIALVVFRVC